VLPGQSAAPAMLPADFTGKLAGTMMTLPYAFSGKAKNITVFDCSGKLLQKAVIKKNMPLICARISECHPAFIL
jgi:hypothetical protein